jgi:hypothetical protein
VLRDQIWVIRWLPGAPLIRLRLDQVELRPSQSSLAASKDDYWLAHPTLPTWLEFWTFSFQDIRGLQNQELIERLQDQVHTNMQEYITHHYPGQPNRFGNVLLRLPELRSISTKITERLFFLNVTHADYFNVNTRLNEFLYTQKWGDVYLYYSVRRYVISVTNPRLYNCTPKSVTCFQQDVFATDLSTSCNDIDILSTCYKVVTRNLLISCWITSCDRTIC